MLFVDADAAPGGDGTSWESAFQHPQQAVDSAQRGDSVWVAQGVYPPLERDNCVLCMADHVSVYGGFAGYEARLGERSATNPKSVLDALGQVQTVVVGSSYATLDGFEIRGAWSESSCASGTPGGGIFTDQVVSLFLRRLYVHDNEARSGGGAFFRQSSVHLEQSEVRNNVGKGDSGGIAVQSFDPSSTVVLHGVRVESNTVGDLCFPFPGAGANFLGVGGRVSISNSRFVDATAASTLGNSSIVSDSQELQIHRSVIVLSPRDRDWPGINTWKYESGSFSVDQSTIVMTPRTSDGGIGWGALFRGETGTFTNVIFWDMTPISPGRGIVACETLRQSCGPHDLTVTDSMLSTPNSGWNIWPLNNIYANPGFRDPANGDFHVTQGSPAIDAAWNDALPQLDADGLPAFDDAGRYNRGGGAIDYADIGAYEFQGTTTLWLQLPSAAATWTVGEAHTIAWRGGSGTVTIEIQRDNNPWEVLASGLSATDSAWTWTVSGAPSERAWVRVRQEGTTDLWDVADLPVVLAAP